MKRSSDAPALLLPVGRAIPFVIAASYCLLAIQPDLRLATPTLVGVGAVVTMALALTLYIGEKGSIRWSAWTILTTAAALRLLFLFRSPELSDDLYRYLWDGHQLLTGRNPYALAPAEAPAASAFAASLIGKINHPELATIYPPMAQLVFAAAASLGGGIIGFKAFLTAMDILACYLLIRLLDALGLPPWRAVLYAWHPLAVLEIAGSGHIDGAGALLLITALLTAAACRLAPSSGAKAQRAWLPIASGLALCAAGLVKLFPFIFSPAFLLLWDKRSKALFCASFAALGIVLTACFLPDIRNGLGTLSLYARHWEFSGFAFKTLKAAGLSGNAARTALAGALLIAAAALYRNLWLEEKRRRASAQSDIFIPMMRAFYGVTVAFLLTTPTFYPWYALCLAALLPFAAEPAGLALSWATLLSYQTLIPYALLGLWIDGCGPSAAICLSTLGALLLARLARRSRHSEE